MGTASRFRPPSRPRLVSLGLLLLALGCDRRPPASRLDATNAPAASVPAPEPPSASASRPLPPLGGEWLVHLRLEGFGPAAVAVPLGATTARPIVVALHGRNDRPEWACGEWRGAAGAEPFILCPHGVPVDAPPERGLAFAGAAQARKEIDAGLDALRARFGQYVAEGPMIYAGFSLGAILGVSIVSADASRFPVAVLGEGGQAEWTRDRAAAFARGGGRRVLFVCSTGGCEAETPRAMATLRREGIGARVVSAGQIGHLVDDRVVAAARGAWGWVVEGEGDGGPR